jgi:membrane protease YdiL (CAAX protease family)
MKPVTFFLLITFLISWIAWGILIILTQLDILQFNNPAIMTGFVIGGISPAVSGFITRLRYEKNQFKTFLLSHLKFKLHIGWYLFLVLIPLVLTAISWFYYVSSTLTFPPIFKQPVYMVIVMLPVMILGGGLEEIGWRGVMLPELVKKISAFYAALIIAVIWLIWHFPLFLVKGSPQSTLNLGWFTLSVITMSFVYTAFYLRIKSIGMCILFHAFFNVYGNLCNYQPSNPWIDGALKIVISLCLFYFLMRKLTKKPFVII